MCEMNESRPGDAKDRVALRALIEQANGGDPDALAKLGEFLDHNPEFWRKLGDLGGHAQTAWVKLIAAGNSLLTGSVTREADRLRSELLAGQVSPLERLLVSQIVAGHLELEYYRMRAAESPGGSLGQISTLQKQLDGAQRRFLESIKTLDLVRRLAARADAGSRLKLFKEATG